MWWRTRRSPSKTASPGREIVVAAFPSIDEGMASKQIAPRTSSMYRRRVRRSCCVDARKPMILRSGAGLASRWAEASFDDAREPRNAVQLPPWCNAVWTHPTRKDRMVCWDAPAPAPSRSRWRRGTVCPAAAVTCETKLRSRSIALPSRRTGWDSLVASHRPDDGRPCPRQNFRLKRCRTEWPVPVGVDSQAVLGTPCGHNGPGSWHCRSTGTEVRTQRNKRAVVSVHERRRKVNAVQAAQQRIHVAVEELRPHDAAFDCHG
ncbi:hypothetical protein TCDM_11731 [Trypanosoma cruzi Dm28c]|uniref:Uncharacterized protein n=1 Tax=Trypanosoma cruzi Dm28c TaxID=1416333 RepID=V5AZM8_TRYCR|nr:hypothetical protein TCDM_11731 [Trypanosoma cruzi Dm28c]